MVANSIDEPDARPKCRAPAHARARARARFVLAVRAAMVGHRS
eukprot:COSAG02_NODE_169_length_31557_cov_25.092473_13_plen_43_part_00